jgi:hypothetical protein
VDGPDRFFLVGPDVRVGHEPLHCRMEDAVGDQIRNARPLLERPREADERALAERRRSRGVQLEEISKLLIEARVGKRVGGELVVEKVIHDPLGELDGVDGHGSVLESREAGLVRRLRSDWLGTLGRGSRHGCGG